jgi:hypothetical protein
MYFTDEGPPFGKELAVCRAEPRIAPMADMGAVDDRARSHFLSDALSISRDLTLLSPSSESCLPATSITGGTIGAGNETTETKTGTETETDIRAAGPAAPAAQDGTRNDQVCSIHIRTIFVRTMKKKNRRRQT